MDNGALAKKRDKDRQRQGTETQTHLRRTQLDAAAIVCKQHNGHSCERVRGGQIANVMQLLLCVVWCMSVAKYGAIKRADVRK